jgi:hypothetical protein
MTRAQRLRARRRASGLVYVETLVTLPVVIYFTMITIQLTDYFVAVMLAKHAAISAARAAAVVGSDDPQYYGGQGVGNFGGQRLTEIRKAAQLALSAKPQFQTASFGLTLNSPNAAGEMVNATLSVDYQCAVPALNAVCGFSASRSIVVTGSFPYQPPNPSFD